MHRFNYKWYLKNGYPAKGIEKHNKKVFSTFACGGGSSMGYKLAGYDVIGANDIDPEMAKVYKQNHHPKYYYECPISNMLTMELPDELYNLDILDGSPPCSTFSVAGQREKNWKKKKKFREGQSEQVLSDLFFDWIKLVERLQPKVAIAENVKGMLIGNAKLYTKQVVKELERIGYKVQVFLLNSASMGVPQKRERVFFICNKLNKNIKLNFKEIAIPYKVIEDKDDRECNLTTTYMNYWKNARPGDAVGKYDSHEKVKRDEPLPTITASGLGSYSDTYPRTINVRETILGGSFPMDYDFTDINPNYLIGMSVPPVMMANVSYEVYNQIIKNS